MTTILEYLPPHPGLLPQWLLLTSVLSIVNGIQDYSSFKLIQSLNSPTIAPRKDEVASPSMVAKISRLHGTWTILSAIIRIYAAYNIEDPAMYQLTIWTFANAVAYFGSEYLVFGSAQFGSGLLAPLIVGTMTPVWMITKWTYYVQ